MITRLARLLVDSVGRRVRGRKKAVADLLGFGWRGVRIWLRVSACWSVSLVVDSRFSGAVSGCSDGIL